MRLFEIVFLTTMFSLPSFCALAQIGGPSQDAFKAQDLYLACNMPKASPSSADDTSAEQICQTYIRGLTDGLFLMKAFSDGGQSGCLPTNTPVSNSEARDEFNAFVKQHPESLKNSAGVVAAAAIIQAHPCP